MNCNKCGNPIHPNDNICAVCGEVVPKNTCSNCGTRFSMEAEMCPNCGTAPIPMNEASHEPAYQSPIEEAPVEQAPIQAQSTPAKALSSKQWMPILVVVQSVIIILLSILLIVVMINNGKSTPTEGEPQTTTTVPPVTIAVEPIETQPIESEPAETEKTEPQPSEEKPAEDGKEDVVKPEKYQSFKMGGHVKADGGLNLRKGPGTNYDVITVLPDKSEFKEVGYNQSSDGTLDWVYIESNNELGWAKYEYLSYEGASR